MIERPNLGFEGHFTLIPNAWARDPRLSRKAKGLLAELLSHRPGWKVSVRQLAKVGKEGRDAVYAAVAELVEHGYLERTQGHAEGGLFGEVDYRLRDPHSTASGLSVSGSSVSGESGHKEEHLEEDHSEVLMLVPAGPSASDRFDEFWAAYPRAAGKGAARAAFLRMAKKHDVEQIIAGARRLAQDPNLPEKQFIPYPATWLNREGWEDEALPERSDRPRAYSDDDEGLDWLAVRS
ncbi:helix-turn-helix domain-containing protein [Rathayibacter sp. Leaf248]|uniref:helix-turn-helix domain-containing protein n=1 Tax=Rathayibacter sp. Leaf248 TaxID=2876555 RepID=UPI001E583F7B|nr:helix-turn-helix domain-containing protein [Rathayibacter sp. Leaf248]